MEAVANINYNCGCGFQTKDDKKAIEHSQKTGHSLTVLGTVSSPPSKQGSLDGRPTKWK